MVCEEDGKYIIHGATSFGNGCALEEYPGVWSRVYEHMDFVDQHLRQSNGGSGCEDTDNGKKDNVGDGCTWYTENDPDKHSCGEYDDSDFKAEKMCCHCGGGTGEQPTPAPTPDPNVCRDTEGDAEDSDGDDCAWYTDNDEHGEHCGHHDDSDFDAHKMCCRCGGGSTGSGYSRLFEDAGPAVPAAKAQVPTWQALGVAAVVASAAGAAALVAVARRASRRDDQEMLAAGSDTELVA